MPESTENIRHQIEQIGVEIARSDALLDERGRLVEKARAEKMTYREIAQLLGMTETGLRKSQKAYLARVASSTSLEALAS